jgi:hypothetical protein
MPSLRPETLATCKRRLADGHDRFDQRHQAGESGVELCAAMTGLRDEIMSDLADAALIDVGEADTKGLWNHTALVAHGGYGRRDVAPYSDVDLMILHSPSVGDRVAVLAERLLRVPVGVVGTGDLHFVDRVAVDSREPGGFRSVCTELPPPGPHSLELADGRNSR